MTHTPTFDGLKVVEFAHIVAGPLAGGLLADLGATVVHVEDPASGDPTRRMGQSRDDGRNVWWPAIGRNKRSVTLDLRSRDGQELARRLASWADVVITNMRPSTLVGWGLDWTSLHALNPRLVMLQISANGVNSSRPDEPGFGKVGEARSGAIHLNGLKDGPPMATGFSQADAVTGLMGAFAISAALTRRHEDDFDGEWIDLALFESLFRLIDWQVPMFDQIGYIATRAGNQVEAVPTALINTYATNDKEYIIVTSGTPKSVQRIAALVGLPAADYASMAQLADGRQRLDDELANWVSARTAEDCLKVMAENQVVASKIFTVADIVDDPIFLERDDVITVDDPGLGAFRMHGIIPRMENRPGAIWRTGPQLGEDNEAIYAGELNLSADELAAYRSRGTI
ncbi:CoA transferase [Rhodococcus sp. WS4]|nr:CoA transferase [Rhodococcus sp. WS4]